MSNQLGKLPPQVIELEEAVLGALMIDKEAINQVIDILRPESFYKPSHQEIYRAMFELFSESDPIDMLTVTQKLRKKGKAEMVGGPAYIMRLTSSVNSSANIEAHARFITEQAIKRELITISSEIQKEAFEDSTDVFELLDTAEQKLFQISESNIRKNFSTMPPLIQQAIREIEARKDLKDGLTGIPTGFTSLDRITAGWQKSDLVILAARPGMGKTAFSLTMLRNAAVDFSHPVAIFSLEMSELQLVNRLISAEAELESDKLKRGNLAEHEWTQLYHKTKKISDAPIFIDDTPGLSVLELRAKCRRLKAQHDIQLVVVDYLQLMTASLGKSGGNREQEIALISRSLKNLAKELNVPVIALSQLSRAVETRGGDKRPQLSDLRESGCITGDSLILNSETGELVPIRELAERQTQRPFTCAALDAQLKVKPHQLVKAFYSGKKPVFELLTRSGRSIKASANHPFLRLNGWTRLDALSLGDKIAVPRCIHITNPSNPLNEDELVLLANQISIHENDTLPKTLFQCDNESVALFLRHLWATDENISWAKSDERKEGAAIYYGSSSRKICEQVQHLLLRLGILSGIKTQVSSKGYHNIYHVKIEGVENQIQFLEKVGCFGERGQMIPTLLDALKEITANPNYDAIPKEAWQAIIRPLKDGQGIAWREFAAQLGTAYSGGSLFKHGIARNRMQNIAQLLPFAVLHHLAKSDVLWDEIMEIRALGEEDVYDATVAEVHNFVANDIILHNSIEQDADMVIFLYRPEYYGITEDMEGNPTKDLGEVIIAKHRNGSLADVKLKFIGKYTKFTNLENDGFDFGNLPEGQKPGNFRPIGGAITISSKINETRTAPPEEPPF
ncbi:MAG: hypothetical protein OHK0053_08570 [Microscillaceae bacterium]